MIAGLALVIAAVVGLLALRDGDDPEELDTASASGATTTVSKPPGSDEPSVVEDPGDAVTGDKGASAPGGSSDSGDKGSTGAPGTTARDGATTSSSSTSTTTTRPPTQLNHTLPAVYGSTALGANFVPEPFLIGVTGGGPVSASYLGGGCSGHTTEAPTFSVIYTPGSNSLLRFYFIGSGDTTMIINSPAGSYFCVDDSFGTLNPTIDFNAPAGGRYDIWIASYAPGSNPAGTLYVTRSAANHP